MASMDSLPDIDQHLSRNSHEIRQVELVQTLSTAEGLITFLAYTTTI